MSSSVFLSPAFTRHSGFSQASQISCAFTLCSIFPPNLASTSSIFLQSTLHLSYGKHSLFFHWSPSKCDSTRNLPLLWLTSASKYPLPANIPLPAETLESRLCPVVTRCVCCFSAIQFPSIPARSHKTDTLVFLISYLLSQPLPLTDDIQIFFSQGIQPFDPLGSFINEDRRQRNK